MITHRITEILTYNPNLDFGAVYTNTNARDSKVVQEEEQSENLV